MKNPQQAEKTPARADKLDGYVIRASGPAGAEGIAALSNLPGYRYGTLRLPFQTVAETRSWLESPPAGAKQLVADHDGTVVGIIGINTMLGRRRHVASLGMGVHDEFSGRGIGSALMAAAIDLSDNWLDLRRLELTVFTDNEPAIRLYEKNGFVKEGQLRDYAFRNGHYVDAYTMARLKT